MPRSNIRYLESTAIVRVGYGLLSRAANTIRILIAKEFDLRLAHRLARLIRHRAGQDRARRQIE